MILSCLFHQLTNVAYQKDASAFLTVLKGGKTFLLSPVDFEAGDSLFYLNITAQVSSGFHIIILLQ